MSRLTIAPFKILEFVFVVKIQEKSVLVKIAAVYVFSSFISLFQV